MLKKSASFLWHCSYFVPHLFTSSLLILAMTSCACTEGPKVSMGYVENNQEIAAVDTIPGKQRIKEAVANIRSFKGDQIKGIVTFTQVPGGIKIVADIDGLSPGKHGFHIHEFGDCSGDGSKTGSHFNPTNSEHGGFDGPVRHVGDLGNIEADETGHAHYQRVDRIIRFEGSDSILGCSLVIHSDPDDYKTQPTGNSGAKIACGVIEAVGIQ